MIRLVVVAALFSFALAQEEGFACEAPVDFMYVLDDSGSIENTAAEFDRLRDFCVKLSQKMLIAEDAVWMGAIQFDHRPYVNVPLGYDRDALETFFTGGTSSRLAATSLGRKYTNVGGGVATAMDELSHYGRANRAKFVLLMTDGASNRCPNPERIHNLIKAEEVGAKVMVIGIGVTSTSLRTALTGYSSEPHEVFYVETASFVDLEARLDDVLAEACIPCPLTCCGNGFCNPTGSPPCVCQSGYTGDDCCNVAPDWLVPLAGATTGLVFLAALAALFLGARKYGTGAMPVPIEEVFIEDIEVDEIEVIEEVEAPIIAAELDLDTDTGAIGAPPTAAPKPLMYPASRVPPSMGTQKRTGGLVTHGPKSAGSGITMTDGSKKYTPFDLPKRF